MFFISIDLFINEFSSLQIFNVSLLSWHQGYLKHFIYSILKRLFSFKFINYAYSFIICFIKFISLKYFADWVSFSLARNSCIRSGGLLGFLNVCSPVTTLDTRTPIQYFILLLYSM
ncbi:hypothetical protein ACP275_07G113200 [Erythranthe tilingii]